MVQPPFSSFTAPVTDVNEKMKADGLSLATVSTRLRRWGNERDNVLKIVLGHTGKRYTIAVMMSHPNYEQLVEAYADLREIDKIFGDRLVDQYVLGEPHARALMFHQDGNRVVLDKQAKIGDPPVA